MTDIEFELIALLRLLDSGETFDFPLVIEDGSVTFRQRGREKDGW